MNFTVEPLDPEWTVFIRCPRCPARTFSCCGEHAKEGMTEHLAEAHTISQH